jgi:hypothetical protein
VSEYWVVDVQKAQVIAFKIIANRGSERLTESQVLAGLKVGLLEEGLRRTQSPGRKYRSRQLVFRGSSRESSIVLTTAFFFLTAG